MKGYIVKDRATKAVVVKFQGVTQTAEKILEHNGYSADKYVCDVFEIKEHFTVNDYDETTYQLLNKPQAELKNKLSAIYFRDNKILVGLLLEEINKLRSLLLLPKRTNSQALDFIKDNIE